MSGTGKLTDPWDLATAFQPNPIELGIANQRTLWLLDGTTPDESHVITLDGESGRLITIRALSGTRPKLNGSITFNGSYYTIRDLEFFWDGWTTRETAQAGSSPTDIDLKTMNGIGPSLKLINCIIHDLSSPYFPEEMSGLEIYGCIIYHIGWIGSDRGHGHGLYLHNQTTTKNIKDCIIFDNFGWGIHAYAPTGERLKNFNFIGNICFNAGVLASDSYKNFLFGADSGQADTASFIENMSYGAGGLQFYGDGAINITLTDNYIPDGKTGTYTAVSESGNYYGPDVGNQVFVRPNDYQSDRANVTIYNQDGLDSITVDLSSVAGLSAGDTVSVHNVQDYFVDIQSLIVAGDGTIAVDMQAVNRSVATPVGWAAPATTFPDFGAFVLEKA